MTLTALSCPAVTYINMKEQNELCSFCCGKFHLFNILIRRNIASISLTSNIFKVNKPSILNISTTEKFSNSLPHDSQYCINVTASKNYVSLNENMQGLYYALIYLQGALWLVRPPYNIPNFLRSNDPPQKRSRKKQNLFRLKLAMGQILSFTWFLLSPQSKFPLTQRFFG